MSGTTALERAKNVNKELDGINRAHMKAESRKDSAEKTLHRSLVQLRETQGIDLVTLFEEEGVAAVARKAKSLLEDGRLELEAKVEKAERVVEAYSNSDYGQMRQILGVPEEVATEVESNISASPVEVETEDSESEVEVEEPEVSETEVSEPEVSEPEVSEPEVEADEDEADEDEADEPEAEESDSDEGIADSSDDDDDDPFGFDDDDDDDFTAQSKASDDEPASMTMADLDAKATSEDAAVTSTDDDDEDWGSLSFGDLLGNGPASL